MNLLLAPLAAIGWVILRLLKLAWLLARRPRLSVPLLAIGLLAWLAWPVAGAIGGGMLPVYVIGGAGTAAGGLLIGRALLEQRRFDRDLDLAEAAAAVDAEPGAARTAPAWADE